MRLLITLSLLLLGGCQRYTEHRVQAALEDAGLSHRMASCMAERLVERLTPEQLRKLKLLKGKGRATIGEVFDRLERLGDAQMVAVLTSSATGCAL